MSTDARRDFNAERLQEMDIVEIQKAVALFRQHVSAEVVLQAIGIYVRDGENGFVAHHFGFGIFIRNLFRKHKVAVPGDWDLYYMGIVLIAIGARDDLPPFRLRSPEEVGAGQATTDPLADGQKRGPATGP